MPFWLLIVFIFHSYWLCTSLLALANETMSSTYIKAVFANITHCTQLIILKYLYKVNLNKQTNNVWLNPIKPDFLKSYCFHTKCILNKRTWKCYFSKRITMSRTVAAGCHCGSMQFYTKYLLWQYKCFCSGPVNSMCPLNCLNIPTEKTEKESVWLWTKTFLFFSPFFFFFFNLTED